MNSFIRYYIISAAVILISCTFTDKLNAQQLSLQMAHIQGGEFLMGEDKTVEFLESFYIDIYEVPNKDYMRFVNDTGHDKPLYRDNPDFNKFAQPVVGVSWYNAAAFCEWQKKRLPKKAEWEKAGGWDPVNNKNRRFPWGDEYDTSKLTTLELAAGKPTIVGTNIQGKSPYGLFDMAGNVWEWINDWHEEGEDKLGSRIKNFRRIVKGGSWGNKYNSNYALVWAPCCSLEPGMRLSTVGFRCAR